ncbi:MAG: GNAT family N-acetyltransferase [bacterium]
MIKMLEISNNEFTLNEKSFISWDLYDNEDEDYIQNEKSSQYIRIDYVVTDENERGYGIATKMMNETLKEIQNKYRNLPIYIVATDLEKNTDIQRLVDFYEKFGFNVVGTAGDGVLMKK